MFQILFDIYFDLKFSKLRTPIISTLMKGKVKVEDSEGVKEFEVKGGVVENLKNNVVILAE